MKEIKLKPLPPFSQITKNLGHRHLTLLKEVSVMWPSFPRFFMNFFKVVGFDIGQKNRSLSIDTLCESLDLYECMKKEEIDFKSMSQQVFHKIFAALGEMFNYSVHITSAGRRGGSRKDEIMNLHFDPVELNYDEFCTVHQKCDVNIYRYKNELSDLNKNTLATIVLARVFSRSDLVLWGFVPHMGRNTQANPIASSLNLGVA
ncbi:hypothetical protein L0B53_18875 (plasmid) [Vibrio sp. SS-MA-C1-2]|uniref:hypothetical protein n=1 Tax=Vibrio sp. SS-MA-C1-2 TaxID=2908646 RepID=UPI001F3992EF|nr:hypothetical protein [Vibrio sp. SS-MA-C1-2]UJF20201.1 hypothetical protein L0B53_18875 [Vibrio sp. SS-MA-C1-2]